VPAKGRGGGGLYSISVLSLPLLHEDMGRARRYRGSRVGRARLAARDRGLHWFGTASAESQMGPPGALSTGARCGCTRHGAVSGRLGDGVCWGRRRQARAREAKASVGECEG
jgi:hypothetical protein